ncbi:AraC family transcriptional regulator [Lacihabitans sp. CS3-21]|jgi:AraC family transcriptional regulator, transcriptional activator of pobA|uniref:helix-turn-helix domain-containing protein n=1 Tax=Lacihabitans sp. CS3-21 TaxID=2487332 RepID=UPI0020CF34F5|nr:response regulator transcription factor [Lacihabitans sp. CS3-21]MCP9746760.1 AraC family transcriptional regulator [Lacihabitans sp. CS3-21]
MEKIESLQDFYSRKFEWIPENLGRDIGHVNVFRLPHPATKPVPYRRRDFFKITLCRGSSRIHYADKVFSFEKQALVFSNPFIPYKWEHVDDDLSGFYVVFDASFFNLFGNLIQYEVFQPTGTHVFELDDTQFEYLSKVFEKIETELNSEYIHKYDAIRNQIYELIHYAMKTRPSSRIEKLPINASQRIYWLFLELLERQFPIDENHTEIILRTASDFAFQLNVHVNHLNRAVKEAGGKTTSQLIAERLLQESKIMLKQSKWNISEIAYSLGFQEVTHFNNFFKKHTLLSPTKFRNN